LEEAVAEKFGDGGGGFLGHGVEAAVLVEQAVGGEDVEVRVVIKDLSLYARKQMPSLLAWNRKSCQEFMPDPFGC
jgi:hypothetical protein